MADELTCPLCGRTCRDDGDWRGHLLGRHRKSEIVADLADRIEAENGAESVERPAEGESEPRGDGEEMVA